MDIIKYKMFPKSELGLGQNQKLTMVPALRQALKILQYPLLELQDLVEQELLENPFLEEVKTDTQEEIQPTEDNFTDADLQNYFESIDNDFENKFYNSSNGNNFEFEDRCNLITKQQTLSEFLLEQLRLSEISPEEYKIGEVIIGNIDENGYLKATIEDIAREVANVEVDRVEKVLNLIQTFEPAGVGARDLKECLLIQIREKGFKNTLAEKILIEYWDGLEKGLLEKRHYNNLIKTLGVSLEEVHNAFQIILKLDPKPGRNFGFITDNSIIPDVIVENTEDGYIVRINEDGLSKLRINRFYYVLFKKEINKETKDYMNEKLQFAYSIIKGIEERKKNLLKVSEIIVDIQKDFLDNGIEYLKPLILKDIAIKTNLHESTVSRLVAGKYMQTPCGFISFKSFFSGKVSSVNGPDVSSASIKEMIKELIESEDPINPLSDKKIVDKLSDKGVKLARRTIAKYREKMNIQSSNIRSV